MWSRGPLRRWWGPENKDFMNGLILLWNRPPRSPLSPSSLWGHSEDPAHPPRTELHQNLTILTPSSQMSGLQICRKCLSVAEAPSLLFCYGSPSRLRQCALLHLLLLLSIMCLRCIHIVACVRASVLFTAESYSTVWMDCIVCISSLIACWWSLGWFPRFGCWKFHCYKHVCMCLGLHIRVELLGHVLTPSLTFWGSARMFSKMAVPFHIPTSAVWKFELP